VAAGRAWRPRRVPARFIGGIIAPMAEPLPSAPEPAPTTTVPAPRRARRLEAVVFLAALAAALAAAAIWGGRRSPEAAFEVSAGDVGPAPDVALPDLSGRTVRLADFQGRVVILNFWATWCQPCRDEMPAMQALATALGARGLVLLPVDYAESDEAVAAFARELGLTGPLLLDTDGAVARRYRVPGLPASFFVDRQGRLVGTALGYRDWRVPAARAYVERLLAGG
jgi:thiol-disulfide isomerase/thioredoxin